MENRLLRQVIFGAALAVLALGLSFAFSEKPPDAGYGPPHDHRPGDEHGAEPDSPIGKMAPDFKLKDLEGRDITLDSLKGRPTLINFWATWCSPCLAEMPSLQRLHKNLSKTLQVVTISVDEDRNELDEVLKELKIALPVLLDPDGKVSKLYGTEKYPETYILDSSGVIVDKRIGAVEWDSPKSLERIQKIFMKSGGMPTHKTAPSAPVSPNAAETTGRNP